MTAVPVENASLSPTPPVPRPGPGALLRTWGWGWLAIVQLIGDLLLAGPYLAVAGVLVAGVSSVPALLVGVPLTVVALLLARGIGAFERLRLWAFVGSVRLRIPPRDPAVPWWRRLFFDPHTWRACAHLTLIAGWGLLAGTVILMLTCVMLALALLPFYRSALPGGTLAVPVGPDLTPSGWLWGLGLAGLVLLPLIARGLVGVDLALGRALLGPGRRAQVAALTERVETLTHTRELTVDSVELERRRIERDLHDGPQQRLVAIAMDLGMARQKLDDDPQRARELLDKAHTASKEAIVEMRQVARGIHPPVLTDRGLDAALSALAARSPIPVAVSLDLPHRPSATIEAIAYFCVSEALTNVAKHSQARAAKVAVTGDEAWLRVRISDDGRGGADPSRGTGLVGLRHRLAAVDGTLTVESPPDRGTTLTLLIPQRRSPSTSTSTSTSTEPQSSADERPPTISRSPE